MFSHVYEYYRYLFSYDPETGVLRHARGPRVGAITGSAAGENGYLHIYVGKKTVKAHRIIWSIIYSEEPPEIIDHENRAKGDNRKANLRKASARLNRANSSRSHNKTGYTGVSAAKKRYRACVYQGDKRVFDRCFSTAEEAAIAYDQKVKELFGEFASTNF